MEPNARLTELQEAILRMPAKAADRSPEQARTYAEWVDGVCARATALLRSLGEPAWLARPKTIGEEH